MVKLDVSVLKYLSKEDFRVLTALEMGMKNHDLVPTVLINTLSNLKFGGCHKSLMNLHKHKLIFHQSKPYDGYRLTYAGYDYLVLKALCNRGVIAGVGRQIGVGKESDIYVVVNDEGTELAFKFHRLGRTSFRTIKRNRDYHRHRKSASWLYLSRLAAIKEFIFLKALYEAGFPVPVPVDHNRHGICMELLHSFPLAQVQHIEHPDEVYKYLMDLIIRLAENGVIHGDFNEFNLMIDANERITMIDFPQMVSTDHENAELYFDRDVQCIRTLFERKYGYVNDWWPELSEIERKGSMDKLVEASGFTREMQKKFEKLLEEQDLEEKEVGSDEESDEDEESSAEAPTGENVVLINRDDEDVDGDGEGLVSEDEEDAGDGAGDGAGDDAGGEASEKDDDETNNAHAPKPKREMNDADRRRQIQKRIRQKLDHAERRKKGVKNTYKNRERNALKREAKQRDW